MVCATLLREQTRVALALLSNRVVASGHRVNVRLDWRTMVEPSMVVRTNVMETSAKTNNGTLAGVHVHLTARNDKLC